MSIKRYIEDGAFYFVTSVTKNREKIFKNKKMANMLLATIEYFKYFLDYVVCGYVIMPEHFHLLIQPSKKYNISKVMNYIKGNFSRRYNKIMGITGNKSNNSTIETDNFNRRAPLRVLYEDDDYCENNNDRNRGMHVWQKRFYDEIIRDERDFRNKLDYMHYNPVKAGLVERAEDYEFSSYHQYYGKVRNVVQVAIEKIVL